VMVVPLWRLARRTMAVAAAANADGRPVPGAALSEGDAFKAFMVAYLGLRLLVDFFKPYPAVFLGLGVLQWACVVTIAYYARDIWRWAGPRATPAVRPQQI